MGGNLHRLSRRDFLVLSAMAAAAAACSGDDDSTAAPGSTPGEAPDTTTPPATPATTTSVTTTTLPAPELAGPPFTLGVASGDPLPDAVVIWTRLAPDPVQADGAMPAEPVPVRWEVSTSDDFTQLVAEGTETARPEHGHSVHVDVPGLEPETTYWYRFRVGDHESPPGRTRTAPGEGGDPGRLAFGVASCQAYQSGYFASYADMAQHDLDAVLFVGDYIYELEASTDARPHGLPPPRTLEEYRVFYGLYKTDADLQAAHAAFPWILTWDDHEVEDNYAALQPGGVGRALDPNAESNFPEKRRAAYQAWWEHVPIRTGPPDGGGGLRVYRSFDFGGLVTAAVVDNRQYRDPIPESAGAGALPRPLGGGPQVPEAFDENRSMLGFEQEEWLAGVLTSSGAVWKLLVQQTLMAEIDRRPDLPDAGFSSDSWDGYVANRNRLLGLVADEGISNFVAVGGDIHTAAVADLRADYKDPASAVVGAELVSPSISALELIQDEALAGARSNGHVHEYEPHRRGWLLLTVGSDELRGEFRFVDDPLRPGSAASPGSVWVVPAGDPQVRRA